MTIMSRTARDRARQLPSSIPISDPTGATDIDDHRYPTGPLPSDYFGRHEASLRTYPNYPAEQLPEAQTHQSQAATQMFATQRHHRRSKSQSRSSHERGHSAPPPIQWNPWDIEPEPMTATVLPHREEPQVWKALPPTPDQLCLDHEDIPRSQLSFTASTDGLDRACGTSIAGPEDPAWQGESQQRPYDGIEDHDRTRTKEMQSLATAMMTVDNGFEDQWWYQGPRLVNIAGELFQAGHMPDVQQHDARYSWPGTARDGTRVASPEFDLQQGSSSMVDIVSPISDLSDSTSNFTSRYSIKL